jgi:hypothetical protein
MKFELEPSACGKSDEELLADLGAVATRVGSISLTQYAYEKNGRFSAATFRSRFGSWNHAL